MDILRLIICGYENSGTTLISTILRQHPRLDSGFEGGFLLGETPREFPGIDPHYRFFKECWEVNDDEATHICDTEEWDECYRRAREMSPVIKDKNVMIIDKTPAYMRVLSDVLNKVPQIPCVVIVRDPRAVLASWAKRTGFRNSPNRWSQQQLPSLCERYVEYADGYSKAVGQYSERLFLIQFEHLCIEPIRVLTRLFKFVNLEFRESYIAFSTSYGVHGNGITRDYLYSYRDIFSPTTCDEILRRTRRHCDWHFTGPHVTDPRLLASS